MTGQNRVGVRAVFSDEAVWRDVLGGAVPLHVFSTDGDLSAPEYTPAGSMRNTNAGPMHNVSFRPVR